MDNPVRRTTKWVVERSTHVRINRAAVERLAEEWVQQGVRVPAWPRSMHLETPDARQLLTYLFVLDSLNFCFWSNSEKWKISYHGKSYDGYFALSLSLRKFFEQQPQRATFQYFADMPNAAFCRMLAGPGRLLFMRQRWDILRSVSRVFVKRFQDDPRKFIAQAHQKISVLVPMIAQLPFFNDVAKYRGRRIALWKRAQILAGDVYGAFQGRGFGRFLDLDYLTAFPDYKLPQILHHLGLLEYSKPLEVKLRNRREIRAGSQAEIEIRSATVWAVEWLLAALQKRGRQFSAFEIDWILWNQSQRLPLPGPYHRTRTLFY